MANTKTFQYDIGSSELCGDKETGIYDGDSQTVRVAAGNFVDDMLVSKAAVLTLFKKNGRFQMQFTAGDPEEIAMPCSMESGTGGKCSCGDPAPSNAGTVVETGGPSPAEMSARVEETAAAMDEVRAAMASEPACFTHAPIRTEPVGVLVESESEGFSVMDVAERLDAAMEAQEAPKPAERPNDASEPSAAPVAVPVAPEEPSGVLLTSAARELRKVPLGAAVSE